MARALLPTTALFLVIAAGLVHGKWTRRWAIGHEIEAAAARLKHVPDRVGSWEGKSLELSRDQLLMAEIAGYVSRRYEDHRRRDAVSILLVCGPAGPISVHTPDICYAGAGYEPTGPPVRKSLPVGPGGHPAEFWHAIFSKRNVPVPVTLSILWAWSSDGHWEAPDNPRLSFASRPALYKLYVIHELIAPEDAMDQDHPVTEFLNPLLAELDRSLFENR